MQWSFQPLLAAAAKLRNLEPTVVLNSPADGGSTSDTTPTLDFTGTDAETNDIRYQVQIATDNLFTSYTDIVKSSMTSMAQRLSGGDPTVSTGVTDENCLVAVVSSQDSNTNNIPCAGVARNGQAFTKIFEYGGSGGTGQPVNISIWYLANPDVGTYNTVADCNGTINECSVTVYRLKNVNTADIVNGYTGASANGTPSSMSVTTDEDGCYLIGGIVSEATVSGVGAGQDTDATLTDQSFENTKASSKAGGAAGSQSLSFTLSSGQPYAQMMVAINRINTGSIVVDKVSGTDAGFANPDNGGDTDPFTSGENIQYTVQSALAAGTYYWRVRGKDPSGSNAYGAWSSTRSFTISSGDATASPSTLSGTLSIIAVTVVAGATVAATVLGATFSAPDPAAGVSGTATPVVVETIISIQAPTITGGATTAPTTQTAALAIQSPALAAGAVASPGVADTSINFQTPGLFGNAQVNATELSASFAIQNPTLSAGASVSPSALSAAFSVIDPSVSASGGGGTATPSVGEATLSLQAPAASGGGNASHTVQNAVFSLQAPSATGGATKGATELSASFSAQNPSVTGTAVANPAVASTAFNFQAPGVFGNAQASPTVLSATFSVQDPDVSGESGGVTATPDVATASFSVNGSTQTGGAGIVAGPAVIGPYQSIFLANLGRRAIRISGDIYILL